jgi:hypothetical protein
MHDLSHLAKTLGFHAMFFCKVLSVLLLLSLRRSAPSRNPMISVLAPDLSLTYTLVPQVCVFAIGDKLFGNLGSMYFVVFFFGCIANAKYVVVSKVLQASSLTSILVFN